MENDEKLSAAPAATTTSANSSFDGFDFSNKLNGNLQSALVPYQKINGNVFSATPTINNNNNHSNNNNNNENKINHEEEEVDDEGEAGGDGEDDSSSSSNELVIDQDAENSSDSNDYDEDESSLDEDEGNDTTNLKRPNSFDNDYLGNFQSTKRIKKNVFDNDNNDDDNIESDIESTSNKFSYEMLINKFRMNGGETNSIKAEPVSPGMVSDNNDVNYKSGSPSASLTPSPSPPPPALSTTMETSEETQAERIVHNLDSNFGIRSDKRNDGVVCKKSVDKDIDFSNIKNIHNSMLSNRRKVFLCSTCGTYYENWNLFLHMREIHKKHLCLFCLGIFRNGERLSLHLENKHNVRRKYFNTSVELVRNYLKPSQVITSTQNNLIAASQPPTIGTSSVNKTSSLFLMCCQCEHVFDNDDDDSDESTGYKNHNCEKYMKKCKDCGDAFPHKYYCKHKNQQTPKETKSMNNIINIYSSSSHNSSSSSDSNSNSFNKISQGAVKNTKNINSIVNKGKNMNNYINMDSSNPYSGLDDIENEDNVTVLPATQTTLQNSDSGKDNSFKQLFSNHKRHDNESFVEYENLNSNENSGKAIELSNKNGKNRKRIQNETMSSQNISINTFDHTAKNFEKQNTNICANNFNSEENSLSKSFDEAEDMPKLLVPKLKVKIPIKFQNTPIESEESSTSSDDEAEDAELDDEAEEDDDDYDEDDEDMKINDCAPDEIVKEEDNTVVYEESQNKVEKVQIKRRSPKTKFISELLAMATSQNISNSIDNQTLNIVEAVVKPVDNAGMLEKSSEVNLTESTIENNTLPVEEIEENDHVKDPTLANTEMEINPDTNGPTYDTDNADNSEMDIEEIKNDDGIALAGTEIPIFELSLNKPLNKFEILEFMRICLQATIPSCLYCNHARKIAVSAQSLALHILANHRFEAIVDSITAEELLPETIVIKLKSSILTEQDKTRMDSIYFNSDTYDSSAIEKYETIPFDKLYECFQCRFVTHTHKELYLHNRKLHQKTIIICQMCDQQFYSYSELLCHMCPGVPNKFIILDYKYRCCLCSLDNITSAFRLMVHLRKKHFACDVCLEACFDQSKLSNHVWKHKLHHVCYRCGIAYRNKVDITKHLFWKHGTESVVCKRCLQKKWPHVYHFCIPPVQFICETCNLIFKRAVSLKVHKRLHTGDAPYPCTEDNCEKKFISRKLLLKHVARHTAQIDENTNHKAFEIKREVDDMELIEAKDTPVFEVKSEKDDDNKKCKDDDSKKSETKTSKKKSKKSKNENKSKNNILDLMKNLQPVNLSESDSSDESENEVTTPVVIPIITEKDTNTKDITLSPKPETETESSVVVLENPEAIASDSAVVLEGSEVIVGEAVSTENETSAESNIEADKVNAAKEVVAVEEVNEAEEVTNKPVPVPDIWDNFKSYQAIHKKSDDDVEDDENKNEDDVKEPSLIHVVQSDHDYSSLYDKTKKDKSDDAAKLSKEIDEITTSNLSTPSKKKSGKSPKKTKNSETSSSDSSSDSDSSCSCGSNCSCSSSSSSNSSSSSDDSDSSNDEDETPKKNKKLPVEQKPTMRPIPETVDVVGTARAPVYIDPDTIIIESDLETDESETDEDFYDEHPQKLANQLLEEKRQQLMMQTCMNPLNNYGIVENSRPSTPSLPEEVATKKKVKAKKKKKERKSSKNQTALKPDIPISGIVNKMDNFGSFMLKQEHVAAVMTPSPNILSPANSLSGIHPGNSLLPHAAASIKSLDENRLSISSESDAALKRSKRRRIPNKFYGYCSDDDSTTTSTTPAGVAAFKPTAPPVLTWCKEDLPSPPNSLNNLFTKDHDKKSANKERKKSLKKFIKAGNKVPAKKYKKKQQIPSNLDHSVISSNTYKPPIPPVIIRPNLIPMAQPPRVEPIRIPAMPVQVINLSKNDAGYSSESNDDSDSSDEGTLQINQEPIKKKLPKLKLSTLSNRKISKKMEEVINEQLPRPSQSLTQQYQEKQQQMLMQLEKNKQEFLIANQQKLQMPPIMLNGGSANVPGIANSITPNMMTSSMIQQQGTEMKSTTPAQQAYHSVPHIPESVYQSNQIRLPIMPPAGCRPAREGESVYCYCRCPYDEVSEMIACDGSNCSIEWFHFECVNIIMPPKGKWYCPECLPKYVDSNGIPYQTASITE